MNKRINGKGKAIQKRKLMFTNEFFFDFYNHTLPTARRLKHFELDIYLIKAFKLNFITSSVFAGVDLLY